MAEDSGVSELSKSQVGYSPPTTDDSGNKTKRKPTKKKAKKQSNRVSNGASNGASNEASSKSNGNNVEDVERTPTAPKLTNDGPLIVNGSQGTSSRRVSPVGEWTPTPRRYASNPVMAGNGFGVEGYAQHGGSTYGSESSSSMYGTVSEPGYWYQPDGYYPHEDASMMHSQPYPPRRNYSPSYMQNYPPAHGYHGYPAPAFQHGYMPYPPRYEGTGGSMMPYPGPPYRPHGYRLPNQGYHAPPTPRHGFHHSPHPDGTGEIEHGPAAATTANPASEASPAVVAPTAYHEGSSAGEEHADHVRGTESTPSDGQVENGVAGRISCSPDTSSSSATAGFESAAGGDAAKDQPNDEKQAAQKESEPEQTVIETILNVDPELVSHNGLQSASATGSQQRPQMGTGGVQDAQPDSPVFRLAVYSLLEILPLTHHLLSSFEAERFSDLPIILTSLDDMFFPITFRVHRMIVSQSPVLASIMQRDATIEKMSTINLIAGKKFSLARAFETALQNMYGLPLVDAHHLKYLTVKALGWEGCPVQADSEKNKGATMDFAICYAVSGALLHNREILDTGFKLIHELIGWDTVEVALHLGLFPGDFLVTYDAATPKKGSKGKKKNKNNNDNSAEKQAQAVALTETLNEEVKETWAPKVVTAALQFFIRNIPTAFHFDRLAQTASLPDRIPHDVRSVAPGNILATNPKLAAVKFGSLSGADILPQPSRECSIASAVFLALPFDSLREALDIMRQNRVLSLELVRAILREREDRRLRALQSYAKKQKQQPTQKKDEIEYPAELQELGYQESVLLIEIEPPSPKTEEEKLRPGVIFHDFCLDREWKGFDTGPGARSSKDEKVIRKKL